MAQKVGRREIYLPVPHPSESIFCREDVTSGIRTIDVSAGNGLRFGKIRFRHRSAHCTEPGTPDRAAEVGGVGNSL